MIRQVIAGGHAAVAAVVSSSAAAVRGLALSQTPSTCTGADAEEAVGIDAAARAVAAADAILLTTGAGFGVDSGLPDFRGNEGFWKA